MNRFFTNLLALGFATTLLVLLPMSPVRALPVSGLYSERIAVANESDSERQRAIRAALESVVLKVTGSRRALELASVSRAINSGQRFVESISYSSETVPAEAVEAEAQGEQSDGGLEDEPNERAQDGQVGASAADSPAAGVEPPASREQRYITVQFARSLVDEMLTNANVPVWGSNRPSVLVWMVLQNAAGERSMLSADSNPEIMALMQDFASRRGLPILFPLLDFVDRQNLDENQVWTFDAEAIRAASQRYGADSVLAARLHFTASGQLVGLWQFIFRDEIQTFDGLATDLEAYLFEPLDRFTTELAGYFALMPEAIASQRVRLRVDGVDDLQAYADLVAYMLNLGVVDGVVTTALNGERIDLSLDVLGDVRQLNELISLDRDLLPVEPGLESVDDRLHYRWTR